MISSGIVRSVLALVGGLCLSFQVLAYSEADLEKLKTTGSCESCDLSGADLYEMDLFKAYLYGANLTGADLTLADLTLANLQSADLTGAIFDETNLSGANLRYATLDEDALDEAVFDSDRTRTKLGFKDLKLGMNIVEIAKYCSMRDPIGHLVGATCYGEDDKAFTFKFSGGGATGVLSFLKVDLVAYTVEGQQRLIGQPCCTGKQMDAITPVRRIQRQGGNRYYPRRRCVNRHGIATLTGAAGQYQLDHPVADPGCCVVQLGGNQLRLKGYSQRCTTSLQTCQMQRLQRQCTAAGTQGFEQTITVGKAAISDRQVISNPPVYPCRRHRCGLAHSQRRNTRLPLVPPKPKEFEIAAASEACRAVSGT
mgnify:CR=1 FL=1